MKTARFFAFAGQNAEDILNKTTNLTVPDWDEI
jgi:hypothetical protein